jgi:hypothetical protein
MKTSLRHEEYLKAKIVFISRFFICVTGKNNVLPVFWYHNMKTNGRLEVQLHAFHPQHEMETSSQFHLLFLWNIAPGSHSMLVKRQHLPLSEIKPLSSKSVASINYHSKLHLGYNKSL